MTVDFVIKRAPKYRVATLSWKGPWSDKAIRSKFEEVERWLASRHVRMGMWIFSEPRDGGWEASIEVKGQGALTGSKRIRLRTLPAARVASVVFDPDEVAARVVWHALTDWARWRKKDKTIKGVRAHREVYRGNPWKDKRAYAQTEVQFVLRA